MKHIKIGTLTTIDQISKKAKFIPSGDVEITDGVEDKVWEELAKFIDKHPSVIVTQEALDIPLSVSTVLREPKRGRYYVLPEPNPVTLHLNEAIEQYNKSCEIHIELKTIPISNFHWQFYTFCNFFRKKSNAVITLVSALECYLNQQIPQVEPITFKGENKTIEELEWINLKDKIKDFATEFYGDKFHETNSKEYSHIIELVNFRNSLVHLKRFELANKTNYKKVNDELIKFDFELKFESISTYMNKFNTGLIEFEEE